MDTKVTRMAKLSTKFDSLMLDDSTSQVDVQ